VAEFTPLPESHELHRANPHDHGGKPLCQRCHRPGEAGIVDEPVALCARCHDPANMKHPTGVAQASAPADLPLGPGGRIVCHTCHDPHDVKAHKGGLRLEYGALCLRCHVRHDAKTGPAKP
jgi:predicted CXXCH cytochrome family protein